MSKAVGPKLPQCCSANHQEKVLGCDRGTGGQKRAREVKGVVGKAGDMNR